MTNLKELIDGFKELVSGYGYSGDFESIEGDNVYLVTISLKAPVKRDGVEVNKLYLGQYTDENNSGYSAPYNLLRKYFLLLVPQIIHGNIVGFEQ